MHGIDERSFNFGDLAPGHVSREAYMQMGECLYWPTMCNETIYEEWYHLFILIPRDVTNLRPDWATCTPSHFGVFDPPVAVQGVESFAPSSVSADPTATAPAETQNPSPSQTAVVPQPTWTAVDPAQSSTGPGTPQS
jgi:hypothetical protein